MLYNMEVSTRKGTRTALCLRGPFHLTLRIKSIYCGSLRPCGLRETPAQAGVSILYHCLGFLADLFKDTAVHLIHPAFEPLGTDEPHLRDERGVLLPLV